MWLILFNLIFMIFWISLQGFFLLGLLIFSKRQKTTLTTLKLQPLIASLNQGLAEENSAYIFKPIDFTLHEWLTYSIRKRAGMLILFKFFVVGLFNENDLWVKIHIEFLLNILELSLNSYLGIFFIIIGLIVRVDLKFSMQKDL